MKRSHRDRESTAMKPQDAPDEGSEPIDYEAPRVLEQVDVEAHLGTTVSTQ